MSGNSNSNAEEPNPEVLVDEQEEEEEEEGEDKELEEDEEGEEIPEAAIPAAYLKAIAVDGFNTPWDKIASDMEVPTRKAAAIIEEYVRRLLATHKEGNFPRRLLDYFNRNALADDILSIEDSVVLMKLIHRYYKKIDAAKKKAIEEKMAKLGKRVPVPEIPNQTTEQKVTFTDANQGVQGPPQSMGQDQPQQGQPGQPVPVQQYQDQFTPYENDESMMKFFLELNLGASRDPRRINDFMMYFRMNKYNFLMNPTSLLVSLKATFGDRVAEAVMMQFTEARKNLPNTAQSLYRFTGASNYQPYGDPNSYLNPAIAQIAQNNPALAAYINQYGGGLGQFGGFPPGGMSMPMPMGMPGQQVQEPQDGMDKEMTRLSKIIGMQMMQQMAKSQMGGGTMPGQGQGASYDPSLYDVHEVFDATGRMTERRLVRKGYPTFPYPTQQSQSPAETANQQLMMKFIELMMTKGEETNKLLMQKLLQGDSQGLNSIVETVLKQAVGALSANTDPVQKLNQFLEMGTKVAELKQQPQKSADERKTEMDYSLATKQMQYTEAEKMREYNRQKEEADAAEARYHDTIKEVGNVVKEGLGPFAEIVKNTLGRGLGGNMPGMFPGAPGQVQVPPGYGQPQQRVIIREAPAQQQPQQQNPVGVPSTGNEQPQQQLTPEQYQMLQQEAIRRAQQQDLEMQRQQREDNRPIEDVLSEMPDDEIDQMAHQFEEDMTRMEYTGNKILSERARRKGHAFTPKRDHIAPIVQTIAQHEASATQEHQWQHDQPEEPSINVFDNYGIDEQEKAPASVTAPSVDISQSYDDDTIKESMRVQGMLSPEEEGKNDEQLSLESQTVGTPAPTRAPAPKQTPEPQEEPEPVEFEIDESAVAESDSDNIVEG